MPSLQFSAAFRSLHPFLCGPDGHLTLQRQFDWPAVSCTAVCGGTVPSRHQTRLHTRLLRLFTCRNPAAYLGSFKPCLWACRPSNTAHKSDLASCFLHCCVWRNRSIQASVQVAKNADFSSGMYSNFSSAQSASRCRTIPLVFSSVQEPSTLSLVGLTAI